MVRRDGSDAQGPRRFRREIQLARRISHPNVCRVYELFEDASTQPPRTFLTKELLEGETLTARLARLGPVPAVEALVVFRQIAAGLGAAHDAGVIHRDLKPGNIMLVGGASGRRAVVMDFGLARDPVRSESDGMTQPGVLVGTPEYMAPDERWVARTGHRHLCARADPVRDVARQATFCRHEHARFVDAPSARGLRTPQRRRSRGAGADR
jgi:serine/threonine protein kinase